MNELKDVYKNFKNDLKTMFKEFLKKETNKKQRANMWTFSRLIISFIIPILTIVGKCLSINILFPIAFATAIIGATTDFFDGRSARKYKSNSNFGALLDTISDKMFSLMIGLSLSLFNPLFLINIFGELTIATINIKNGFKNKSTKVKSSIIGKIKQWPLALTFIIGLLSIIIPSLSETSTIMITLTALLQGIVAIDYVVKNKQDNNKSIEKEETINTNNNNNLTLNYEQTKTLNRLDEYRKLKSILNEIIDIKNNENTSEKIKKKTLH